MTTSSAGATANAMRTGAEDVFTGPRRPGEEEDTARW